MKESTEYQQRSKQLETAYTLLKNNTNLELSNSFLHYFLGTLKYNMCRDGFINIDDYLKNLERAKVWAGVTEPTEEDRTWPSTEIRKREA